MNKPIHEKTRIAGIWETAVQVTTKIIIYSVGIILARLLLPEQFGIVGMATVITGVITLISNTGVSYMLTQTHEDVKKIANAAFWMNMALATGLMIIQILIAPLIAMYFKNEMVTSILRVTSISYILSAMVIVQMTLLVRELKFKEKNIIQFIVTFSSAVIAIGIAFSGGGVWSLVLPAIIVAPLNIILFWKKIPWRPSFSFNVQDARKVFSFSKKVLISDVLSYIGNNIDYLLVGKFFGTYPLGIYTFSYKQAMIGPGAVREVIGRVSFSAYSAINREGGDFKHAYQRTIRIASLITFPVQIGLLLLAHMYIPLVFGVKWIDAIPFFRVMIFFGLIRSIGSLGGYVLYAAGKPERMMRWNLFVMPVMAVVIIVAAHFGVFAIAVTTGVVGSILSCLFIVYICRTLRWSVGEMVKYLKPAVLSTAAMALMILIFLFITGFSFSIVNFISSIVIGALTYFLMLHFLFHESKKELMWLISGR